MEPVLDLGLMTLPTMYDAKGHRMDCRCQQCRPDVHVLSAATMPQRSTWVSTSANAAAVPLWAQPITTGSWGYINA